MWKGLFPSIKNKKREERKGILLQAVGCFLAIRLSEILGLFSELYLLPEAQKFYFLLCKRCGVLKNVVKLYLLLEEENFCLICYTDCVLAAPQISESSNVNRC